MLHFKQKRANPILAGKIINEATHAFKAIFYRAKNKICLMIRIKCAAEMLQLDFYIE